MTLTATATVDSVDEHAAGGVVIHAVANGADQIRSTTEGEVTQIEVILRCPEDPGLAVGSVFSLSTSYTKRNPNEPQTPTNTVGPEAADYAEDTVNVSDEQPTGDPTAQTDSGSGVVGPGSAQVDSPVPAEQAPVETHEGEVPEEVQASIEANSGAPEGPGLGQVDAAVPADAGPASDPNSPEGGAERGEQILEETTTEPAAAQEPSAS